MKILKKDSTFFFADTLTKKATFNAIASVIDYFTRVIVSFIITPFIVVGLGDFIYGTWQTLNRVIGFLSPAIGKPTQTLRWSIASQQSSNDFEKKRRVVGSAFITWVIFLPIFFLCGVVLTWYVPYWLKTPPEYITQVRITIIILSINLILINFIALPQSVLEGENIGYKRIGLAASITIFGGILTWIVLFFEQGLVGIATIAFLMSILSGFLYFFVAQANISWFGIKKPSKYEVQIFFKISIWFLVWDLIKKIMSLSDVVIIALLISVESVTSFTLTKYAPEALLNFLTIIIVGVVPGLGGVLGSGEIKKASQLRSELMCMSWLILTVFGVVVLIWNQVFLSLWVGINQYSGTVENLLIVLVTYQFGLIRIDAIIIDLTLKIQKKVILGLISVSISIIGSVILINYMNLGIIGLCLGLIFGRLLMSISYPLLVGNFLLSPFVEQVKKIVRPGIVTIVLFGITIFINSFHIYKYFSGISGWLQFIILILLSTIFFFIIIFFTGLSKKQRIILFNRFRLVLNRFPNI